MRALVYLSGMAGRRRRLVERVEREVRSDRVHARLTRSQRVFFDGLALALYGPKVSGAPQVGRMIVVACQVCAIAFLDGGLSVIMDAAEVTDSDFRDATKRLRVAQAIRRHHAKVARAMVKRRAVKDAKEG